MQPDTPVPTPQKEHSKRGNRRHAPFTVNHNPTALSLLHHCIPHILIFSPLFSCCTSPRFWSFFPLSFHPSSSSSPERLICDWACCVFYRCLAAARGQRGAEMSQCLHILPVCRCTHMKRGWHSIICTEKLKYSRGWIEADNEHEGEGEKEKAGGGGGHIL